MTKQAKSSQIDMAKEFDLTEVGQVKLPEITEEEKQAQIDAIKRYQEQVERTIQFRKKTIKTPFNADFFGTQGETNTKPSLTVPDQTLPIRELLARFAKGLPVGVNTPIYEGEDNDLPDPRTLDLVDLQELKEHAKNEIQAIAARQSKKQTKPTEEQKEGKVEDSKPI